MRDLKTSTLPLNAERLLDFSGGIAPPRAVHLDESLPIPADERLVWDRRLNRSLHSCGCAEGAVGLFVGIATVLMTYFVQSQPWSSVQIAAAVVLPMALLAGGKTIGRRLGRLRFRKACKHLLSRLAADVVEGKHHGEMSGMGQEAREELHRVPR